MKGKGKGKGKKQKKTKSKGKGIPKTKAKGKPKALAAPQEVVARRMAGLEASDPIALYLKWDGLNPSHSIIRERVRSKGWHHEFERRIAAGMSREISLEKAREFGRECVRRWLTHFPPN